ncbi:Transposase [Labrenzia sp. THAF82]|nr:Transposase [Labrenzia sp. THAF82]QFT29599.1 Transposase [Labrenzia sp. THAF82]QFT34030.1 Transposase [Labrenzia sp. THAF82]QFT34046.1 Transposase [Labrenzia sp. THAF82]
MKKSRFTESQILALLKQGESGVPVADLCREHGISNATYYIYGQLSRCKVFEI